VPRPILRQNTLLFLTVVVLLSLPAEGLMHGRVGRAWMAIRGMDVAAETIGIRSLRTKLLAPPISTACSRYQMQKRIESGGR
jgi:ABC-type branched-subunit amino acid transport system permease subunit